MRPLPNEDIEEFTKRVTDIAWSNGEEVKRDALAGKILGAFPLFDDDGLDEEKHHCEWTLQQDRKRLHAMLGVTPVQKLVELDSNMRNVLHGALRRSGKVIAPPAKPAVPLTDAQILEIKAQFVWTLDFQFTEFARAIEAAHGIAKGQNEQPKA